MKKSYIFISKILFLFIIYSVVLSGCKSKQKYIWEEVKYNVLVEKMEQKKSFYAIFKRNDCEYCTTYLKKFQPISIDKHLTVYLINTEEMSEDEKLSYHTYFGDFQYVPVTFQIEKGEIIANVEGEMSVDDIYKLINE